MLWCTQLVSMEQKFGGFQLAKATSINCQLQEKYLSLVQPQWHGEQHGHHRAGKRSGSLRRPHWNLPERPVQGRSCPSMSRCLARRYCRAFSKFKVFTSRLGLFSTGGTNTHTLSERALLKLSGARATCSRTTQGGCRSAALLTEACEAGFLTASKARSSDGSPRYPSQAVALNIAWCVSTTVNTLQKHISFKAPDHPSGRGLCPPCVLPAIPASTS